MSLLFGQVHSLHQFKRNDVDLLCASSSCYHCPNSPSVNQMFSSQGNLLIQNVLEKVFGTNQSNKQASIFTGLLVVREEDLIVGETWNTLKHIQIVKAAKHSLFSTTDVCSSCSIVDILDSTPQQGLGIESLEAMTYFITGITMPVSNHVKSEAAARPSN